MHLLQKNRGKWDKNTALFTRCSVHQMDNIVADTAFHALDKRPLLVFASSTFRLLYTLFCQRWTTYEDSLYCTVHVGTVHVGTAHVGTVQCHYCSDHRARPLSSLVCAQCAAHTVQYDCLNYRISTRIHIGLVLFTSPCRH